MEEIAKFGLIGKNISYSFSKKYFEQKFNKLLLSNYSYDIFDVDEIEKVEQIFETPDLKGLNVTIPYKEKIIPYLDELSQEAQKVGAGNSILIKNGKKIGYNTDTFGFQKTLEIHRTEGQNTALVLGKGGAAKAVCYVLDNLGITHQTVARNSDLDFENLTEEVVRQHSLVIQCTPVGTFPNTNDCLHFPFEGLSSQHLVIDLIYNPVYTQFIKNAAHRGAKTINGFYMLEQQAEKAWEIWKLA